MLQIIANIRKNASQDASQNAICLPVTENKTTDLKFLREFRVTRTQD